MIEGAEIHIKTKQLLNLKNTGRQFYDVDFVLRCFMEGFINGRVETNSHKRFG